MCLRPLAASLCSAQAAEDPCRPCICLPRAVHEEAVEHLCPNIEMDPLELHLTRHVRLEQEVVSKPDKEHVCEESVQGRRAPLVVVKGWVVLRSRWLRCKPNQLVDNARPVELP